MLERQRRTCASCRAGRVGSSVGGRLQPRLFCGEVRPVLPLFPQPTHVGYLFARTHSHFFQSWSPGSRKTVQLQGFWLNTFILPTSCLAYVPGIGQKAFVAKAILRQPPTTGLVALPKTMLILVMAVSQVSGCGLAPPSNCKLQPAAGPHRQLRHGRSVFASLRVALHKIHCVALDKS